MSNQWSPESEIVRELFERDVPQIREGVVEIMAMAREVGGRTKMAVRSIYPGVDPVRACVGVGEDRVRRISDLLGGEIIDILRWNDFPQVLIASALKPGCVDQVILCSLLQRATVVVAEPQISLALGKRGQNVRLAAKLTGWDMGVVTPTEFNAGLGRMVETLMCVEGVVQATVESIIANGLVDVHDFVVLTASSLAEELEIDEATAQAIIARCVEVVKKLR